MRNSLRAGRKNRLTTSHKEHEAVEAWAPTAALNSSCSLCLCGEFGLLPARVARGGPRVDLAGGDIGEGAVEEVDGFVDFGLGERERRGQLQHVRVDTDIVE